MKKLARHRSALYRLESEEEWNQAVEENRPDYKEDFTDLIEKHEHTHGKYEGPGVYAVRYVVINPCRHGVQLTKMSDEYRREMITFLSIDDVEESVVAILRSII